MTRTRLLWRWTLLIGLITVVASITVVTVRSHSAPAASEPLWTTRPPGATLLTGEHLPWVAVARRLKPAVVNISTTRTEPGDDEQEPALGDDEPLGQFFGPSGQPRPHTVRSLGSGFIINPAGYVVTNDHVVDGATEIRVKLSDGRELSAQIVGRDAKMDLALLKIAATGLPVIPLSDSSDLQVGEPVMAIGNPFGLEQTVTTGIVSATGRVIGAGPYDDFIQTDASINPGNSGGPLINVRGQAVGINTAIFTKDGGSNGIGFAIPISLAKSVITQLAASGRVVRGWLGVSAQALTPQLAQAFHAPDVSGALVDSVMNGSPAMKAGLRPRDIILEYGGRPVRRADALSRAVAETPIGQQAALTVLRDGKRLALTATIEELPEPPRVTAAKVTPERRAVGLAVRPLTPALAQRLSLSEQSGLLVYAIEEASPAAEAGLEVGDVIVEIDQRPATTVEDLARDLKTHGAGAPVLLLVHRKGDSLFVALD